MKMYILKISYVAFQILCKSFPEINCYHPERSTNKRQFAENITNFKMNGAITWFTVRKNEEERRMERNKD